MRCLRPSRRRRGLSAVAATVLVFSVAGTPFLGVQKSESVKQLEFGAKVALKGSWNEAAFRFQKAVAADAGNARAYNNLGVARESLGQFDAAREAYEKALSLAPKDEKIQQNFNRFMSFYRSIQPPTAQGGSHAP